MKNKQILNEALAILANASETKIEDLKSIFQTYPRYKTFYQEKRSGGKREINSPIGRTRIVQDNLYYNFLCKISTGTIIESYCCGGVPNKSVSDGINAHLFKTPDFVVDIDLKDAFHCVNRESLQTALLALLHDEVFFYKLRYYEFIGSKKNKEYLLSQNNNNEEIVLSIIQKRKNKLISSDKNFAQRKEKLRGYEYDEFLLLSQKRRLLFPNKISKEFRSLIRNTGQVSKVYKLCKAMAFILAKVLTSKGQLKQGSPTSPILMALVLSHTKLINYFTDLLDGFKKPKSFPDNYQRVSVYVDNMTFGVFTGLSKQELSEQLRKMITMVEIETIWKINMDKIHVYNPNTENPLVTGQRLVRHRKTRQELKDMVSMRIKGAKHCLNAWEPWYYFKPTIPKKMQQKIRSVFHRAHIDATVNKDTDKGLQSQAKGYIEYVWNVYRYIYNVPLQLRKPLEKYCEAYNKKSLVKFYKKTTA